VLAFVILFLVTITLTSARRTTPQATPGSRPFQTF
jgi:hypothetical protein